jgi:hypothetical protein
LQGVEPCAERGRLHAGKDGIVPHRRLVADRTDESRKSWLREECCQTGEAAMKTIVLSILALGAAVRFRRDRER